MKFEVKVSRKQFFAFFISLVVFASINFVVSYNSVPANPAVFGHSANEIGVPICGSGQALTYTLSGWSCIAVGGSGSSLSLPSCNEGQTLNYSSGQWRCADQSGGGKSTDIPIRCSTTYGSHPSTSCEVYCPSKDYYIYGGTCLDITVAGAARFETSVDGVGRLIPQTTTPLNFGTATGVQGWSCTSNTPSSYNIVRGYAICVAK